MRLIFLITLFLVITTKTFAQNDLSASIMDEYIVTHNHEREYGNITYAPGDLVRIKVEGEKKARVYKPTQIKGYFKNGVYYTTKFSPRSEQNIFMPSFRAGDNSATFHKETKLEVLQVGKLNLYRGIKYRTVNKSIGANGLPQGGQMIKVPWWELDIQDNPVYIQDITKTILAEAVKDHATLYARVLKMKERLNLLTMKSELDSEDVTEVVKEYNAWYSYKYASSENN